MSAHYDLEQMLEQLSKRPWYVKLVHRVRGVLKDWFVNRPDKVRNVIERARYGYGHRDLWSFDTYITGVVSRATSELEDVMHGHPVDVTEDQWRETLLEISSGTGVYANQMLDDPFNDSDSVNQRGKEAMKLFADNLDGMWD